jgi:hypothetical protein
MMASLNKAGMDDDLMKTHCIRIDSDGAAMHTGQASGLTPDSKNAFPNVQSVHCLQPTYITAFIETVQQGCPIAARLSHTKQGFWRKAFTDKHNTV